MSIRRGQVWWWNCPEHNRPHVERGSRPVVIVSNDVCNSVSPVVSVVPLTTSLKKPYPQQVEVMLNNRMSIALAEQITSIPVCELSRLVCTLSDSQVKKIDTIIAVQLGLVLSSSERNEGE